MDKFKWLLFLVISVGIILRCRNLTILPIDAHAMRQTDTECSAYFLAKGKADLLHPRACLIRPVGNLNGWFYLEFPVYEAILAVGYKTMGFYPVVIRVINLGLYVLMSVGFYLVLKKWFSRGLAILGVLFLGIAPASIFFLGHAIHPDLLAITALIWSVWFLNNKKILVAAILLGISVATRPFILICWPIYVAIMFKNKSKIKDYLILLFFGLGFYGWWRWWAIRNGIDMSWENWVLSGGEKLFNFGYVKNLVWKNVVGEVMGKTISGLALLGFVLGIIKKEKRLWPILGWLLMVPIYWYVAFEGNLIHQYYADVYILPVVILAAYFVNWLWTKNKLLVAMIIVLAVYNGYRTSQYYFNDLVDPKKLIFAKDLVEKIPEDSRVLWLAKADPVTLSLAHRQGWMLGEWPTDVAPRIWSIVQMKNLGIEYLAEPKGWMDMKREDMVIIEENYPKVAETENINVFRWVK